MKPSHFLKKFFPHVTFIAFLLNENSIGVFWGNSEVIFENEKEQKSCKFETWTSVFVSLVFLFRVEQVSINIQ